MTGITIEKGEGTGRVKGGNVVAVTTTHTGNEATAGRGGIMTEENEMTKVSCDVTKCL